MNGLTVNIGEGAIINSPVSPASSVSIDNGTFRLAERAHIMSTSVLVRFGGTLTIGRYTGIAYDSEIRCEQQVDIGSYNMISYRVCIYDTNTHSTDWRERRADRALLSGRCLRRGETIDESRVDRRRRGSEKKSRSRKAPHRRSLHHRYQDHAGQRSY